MVVVVQQSVLAVDLEVLEAEGDEALPEVVLDGEHAVLGAAVDGGVAEGRGDAALLEAVLPQGLRHAGGDGRHVPAQAAVEGVYIWVKFTRKDIPSKSGHIFSNFDDLPWTSF